MIYAFLAFALTVVLGVLIFSLMPRSEHRTLVLSTYVLLSSMMYGATTEILGISKPLDLEWRRMTAVPIIGLYADYGTQKLHVWTLRRDTPMAYVLDMPEGDAVAEVELKFRKRHLTGDKFLLDMTQGGPKLEVVPGKQLPQK